MENFSFSIFSIIYGVFATFWLSGTSSRTVNAAKSLDFPVKFYQTLSQTHEKTQNFQKPFFSIIWIYVKYTCMQYQFDRLNITIRKKSKTFFYDLIFWLWVLLSHSPPQTWQMSRSEPKAWKIMKNHDFPGFSGCVCHAHGRHRGSCVMPLAETGDDIWYKTKN